MKLIFLKSIIFVLIFIALDKLIFLIYKHEIYDQPYSYGSLSKLYSGTINADIVIFGSSRTMLHLDPAVIESATHLTTYNLAKDGTNIYQSFFTLEEYLLHNKRPKLIIFEADLNQLNNNNMLRFEKEKFRDYSFLSLHTSNLFEYSLIEKISQKLVQSQFAANKPAIFYSFLTKTFIGERDKEESVKDFGSWVFSNGAHLKKGSVLQNDELSPQNPNFSISLSKISLLQKVVDLSNSQHIPILFFSPPINAWKENKSVNDGIAKIKSFSINNQLISHIDFSFDKEFSLSTNIWWNKDHLNISGAQILSRKISEKIMCIFDKKMD